MSSKDTTPSIHIRRSGLGRARGLGAANSGSATWWAERLSSIALLPLVLYFLVSVLFIALILALFYHLNRCMQVVIEDYVRHDAPRITLLLVVKAVIALLALACIISVLKLAFS